MFQFLMEKLENAPIRQGSIKIYRNGNLIFENSYPRFKYAKSTYENKYVYKIVVEEVITKEDIIINTIDCYDGKNIDIVISAN